MTASDDAAYRLPTFASPRRYELHLAPDLEASTFDGTAEIEIEVRERTDRVVCNADELDVFDATLATGWPSDGDTLGAPLPCAVQLERDRQRVTFLPNGPIAPGRYRLRCAFSGVLNDRLRGFYRSTYVDEQGIERVIATTQFEETSARSAFPCFDEPAAKAVFCVTLDAPAGTIALSNGPEIASEPLPGGGRRVRFGPTIPMSTYLVAFIVGPLEVTEARDAHGVPVRVAHPPGRAALTAPALDAAEHALAFYTEYFGLEYPGEKLDMVALPDFAAGAMENLGCVTFREAILLADPTRTSRTELERLAEVVDHELAHMWFGDLVTMRWWNGIWLNEAFATFMALCCEDDYRPEWDVFTSFARSRAVALGIDALHSTRPIEFPVHHPEDAAAMFDVLTYEKGASVLWMIEQYLGRPRFRAGVRSYLAAHAYGNTETTDLWDAIGAEAPEVPVREIMESWLLQGGYPLVHASAQRGAGDEAEIEVRQAPFAYLPAEVAAEAGTAPAEGSAIGADWLIPLLAAPVGSAAEPRRVLLGRDPVRIPAPGPMVLNAGGTGFYRLLYDRPLLDELLAHFAQLSVLERFNLLSDTWATTQSGQGELRDAIGILNRLGDERDPHVWSIAAGALGLLDLLAAESERPALRDYGCVLLRPQLARVGWERRADEDEQQPLLRSTLVSSLGAVLRDPEVLAHAHELFAADHFGGTPLDADLAAAVLSVVASDATAEEVDAVLERYRRPRDPMDQIRHLYSLARLSEPKLISPVLELCLSEFRSQNAPMLLGAMLSTRAAGPLAFAFVREHFAEMLERYPDNLIPRMLEGLASLAQLDENGVPLYLDQVLTFCRESVHGARQRLVNQSLERLLVNVRFAGTVRGQLATALAGG